MLNGIVPYFGAKRELAAAIVSHFGNHDLFYEPFAGSLACLMAKRPCRNEVVSEKNPDVANLIRCLADERLAAHLWRSAELHPASEYQFREAAARLSEPPDETEVSVPRAFDFLLVSWQGLSGVAGTTRRPKFAIRNTASGGSVAARWRAVAPSIPEWHERLRNVEFRCRDAFELIESMPDREGCVVYADSPYFDSSRTGGRYAFDFTPEDHVRLAAALRRFRKTRVVVSFVRCAESDELYAGWKVVEVTANKKLGQHETGKSANPPAKEVLYINE
jgi:DNA adenine methylase